MNREHELYTMSNDKLEQEFEKMHLQLVDCWSNQGERILMICKNIEAIKEVMRSRALEKII